MEATPGRCSVRCTSCVSRSTGWASTRASSSRGRKSCRCATRVAAVRCRYVFARDGTVAAFRLVRVASLLALSVPTSNPFHGCARACCMEYQEYRAPPAVPACAEPLAQLTDCRCRRFPVAGATQPARRARRRAQRARGAPRAVGVDRRVGGPGGAVAEHPARAAAYAKRGAAQTARRS